jgi:hypothetical protein
VLPQQDEPIHGVPGDHKKRPFEPVVALFEHGAPGSDAVWHYQALRRLMGGAMESDAARMAGDASARTLSISGREVVNDAHASERRMSSARERRRA